MGEAVMTNGLDKRLLIYIVPSGVLALAGFLIGESPELRNEVIFVALGINISLLLDLVRKQMFTEKKNFKIISKESELASLCTEFKKKANVECCLTWTAEWKIPDLDTYFHEEKKILGDKRALKIRRLIGTEHSNWTRKEMNAHITDYSLFIASGKYSCKETHMRGFEFVYADYEKKGNSYSRALLIMNENNRKIGFVFDGFENSVHAAMVSSVKEFFESEWAIATSVNAPE